MLQTVTQLGYYRVFFTRKGVSTTAHLVQVDEDSGEGEEIDQATVRCYARDCYSHFDGRKFAFSKLLNNSQFLAPRAFYQKTRAAWPSEDELEQRRLARAELWNAFWANSAMDRIPKSAGVSLMTA